MENRFDVGESKYGVIRWEIILEVYVREDDDLELFGRFENGRILVN